MPYFAEALQLISLTHGRKILKEGIKQTLQI
jgi:hypothetical protein